MRYVNYFFLPFFNPLRTIVYLHFYHIHVPPRQLFVRPISLNPYSPYLRYTAYLPLLSSFISLYPAKVTVNFGFHRILAS